MMWEKKTLGEIINLKRGYDLPSQKRKAGLVPIISSSGITDFHSEPAKTGEGVVTGRYGTLGQIFYINGDYWPLNTTLYVQDFKGNVPSYIYYFLKTLSLEKFNGASAVPGLDRNVLHKIDVNYTPSLPTQRKIASILSGYDDLIENNLKRIKLLEEKAQLHYKELMRDSSKWDKVRLEEFISVVKGRKPANVLELPEEESQLYLLLDTVERGKILYTTDLSLPQSKITDVLMCMDGARSGLSFRGMVGAIGSTMAIWRSNSERVSGELLFQFMKQNESAITQGNTGAAIPHANRKFILDMKIAMPPKKEAEYFDGLTLPMIKLINILHNQNTKLREARDILLPKLMNGQIEV